MEQVVKETLENLDTNINNTIASVDNKVVENENLKFSKLEEGINILQKENKEIKNNIALFNAKMVSASPTDNKDVNNKFNDLIFNFFLDPSKKQDMSFSQTIQDSTKGGVLVPEGYSNIIIDTAIQNYAKTMELCDIIRFPEYSQIIPVLKDIQKAVPQGELQSLTEKELTLGSIDIQKKLYAFYFLITYQLLKYSRSNIENILRDRLYRGIVLRVNEDILLGQETSINSIEGILNKVGVKELTTDTSKQLDEITIENAPLVLTDKTKLYDYRDYNECAYLVSPTALGTLRAMTTLNGNYKFPELRTQNPTINGYKVVENYALAEKNLTTGEFVAGEIPVIFGNFKRGYKIGMDMDIAIDVEEVRMTLQKRLLAYQFIAGKVAIPEAFVKIKIKS